MRNLTLAYALAGADCIDVAADTATIASAKSAIKVASEIVSDSLRPEPEDTLNQRKAIDFGSTPLLMVSLNDGEDPHFRKAEFDPAACPLNCPRPCEKICPAEAIAFSNTKQLKSSSIARHSELPIFSGVIDAKCYGCGRCIPVCPLGLIQTRSYVSTPQTVADLVLPCGVDAVEIHTQVGHLEDFKRLWNPIAPWVHGEGDRQPLKLIAISCPDGGEQLIEYLWSLYQVISPLPCPLIWQTDGRPMSGDIGAGTTHASIKLGQKVLRAGLPGYVQLAGGTNHYTVSKLRAANLLKSSDPINSTDRSIERSTIAGVAYGSYARVLLSPLFDRLEQLTNQELQSNLYLENYPDLLHEAVNLASSLVSQLKMGLELPCSIYNTNL